MPESVVSFIDAIVNNLFQPALYILVPVILFKLQNYVKRSSDSTAEKNEREQLNLDMSTRAMAMERLGKIVANAVASNMRTADQMKSDGSPILTEAEIEQLNQNAKDLTYSMLPDEMRSGELLTMLGGKATLDTLISGIMERKLIEIKALRAQADEHNEPGPPVSPSRVTVPLLPRRK
jgi:hypothetical protein